MEPLIFLFAILCTLWALGLLIFAPAQACTAAFIGGMATAFFIAWYSYRK